MTGDIQTDILPDFPDPDAVRQRLAVVTTEAALLRAQLRVSTRLRRERDRLRRQTHAPAPGKEGRPGA
jgi:hypothetical protein